jgi:hypothetical protein
MALEYLYYLLPVLPLSKLTEGLCEFWLTATKITRTISRRCSRLTSFSAEVFMILTVKMRGLRIDMEHPST